MWPIASRHCCRRLYAALYRADLKWLKAHQPPRERTCKASRIDWRKRDTELHELLKTAFISLTVSPDRPKQITIAALGRKVGSRARLEKHLEKLPKCRRYMMDVVEDRVQYALRRLAHPQATSLLRCVYKTRHTKAQSRGRFPV